MIMKRVNRFGHTNFLKACYRYLSYSPLFKGGAWGRLWGTRGPLWGLGARGASKCSVSQSKWYQVMPVELIDGVELLQQWKRNPLPIGLFLMMCLNLVIAPAVYASAGEAITRKSAWAIGILTLVILGLAIYLFAVILQPERF